MLGGWGRGGWRLEAGGSAKRNREGEREGGDKINNTIQYNTIHTRGNSCQ